ncbi:MAG: helix-turn-helix domain-containing protein [Anaerolineales bacterium]|nr:helix-turn-helix domain-containing protein [Anaerolineales bacterium]
MVPDEITRLGCLLRETREALGLTLEEIEQTIHIRAHHLRSLEEGELDLLPSPVQTRGFLRNYAEFLGLEPDEILLHYAEGIQLKAIRHSPENNPQTRTRRTKAVRLSVPVWFNSDLFLTVLMGCVLVASLVWGGISMLQAAQPSQEFQMETAVPGTEDLQPSETATNASESVGGSISLVLLTPTETATLPLVLNTTSGVGITLIVERSTWLRILVDGEEEQVGRFSPGEVLEFRGEETVEVAAGNAGGVRIFYQGDDIGVLGNLDQAVIRIWTLDGMITPTPVITSTPSPTATPTVTATSTITWTPGPAPGGPDPAGD